MVHARLATWMVWIGLFLTLAAVALSSALVAEWRTWNGPVGTGKIVATLKRAADPSAGFTVDEAERLADDWDDRVVYRGQSAVSVRFGTRQQAIDLIGVGGDYRAFAHWRMLRGTSLSPRAIAESSRVALVSDQLAGRLFLSPGDAVGREIRMLGAAFRIIGVYRSAGTLTGRLTDDGRPDAIVPVTTLLVLDTGARITTIELETSGSAAANGERVRRALEAVGKAPDDFRVMDFAEADSMTSQKPRLAAFACGAVAIALAAGTGWRRIRSAAALIRGELQRLDADEFRKRHGKAFVLAAAAALAAAGLIVGVWRLIRYPFRVPPEWVPEEWIDLSFYRERLVSLWQAQAAGTGVQLSPHELLLNRLDGLVTALSIGGCVVGCAMLWLGVREWALRRVPADGRWYRLTFGLAAAFVLTLAAGRAIGVPPAPDAAADLAVWFAYVLAVQIHFLGKKGV